MISQLGWFENLGTTPFHPDHVMNVPSFPLLMAQVSPRCREPHDSSIFWAAHPGTQVTGASLQGIHRARSEATADGGTENLDLTMENDGK